MWLTLRCRCSKYFITFEPHGEFRGRASRVVKKLERLRPDVYNPTELTEFEQSVIDVGIETEGPSRD